MAEEEDAFYRAPLNPYPVSYVRAKKLLYAVSRGDVRELRHFIPTVYNPNQRFYTTPDNASSASHLGALAIVNNKPEVLRMLLRAGLSTRATNGKNMNLFSEAASVKYVSPEIVDMLFVPDNDGDFLNDQPFEAGYNRAAHLAVLNNNSYLLDRLLRMGKSALVATLRNATGNTALTLAIRLSRYNGGSMAMRLARYTEEVTKESWSSVVDNSGYNALELAEANQLHEVVKILTAPRRGDDNLCSLCRRVVNDRHEDDSYIEEGSMIYDDEFGVPPASADNARQVEVNRYEQIISGLERQHAVDSEAAEERYSRGLERIKHEADIEVYRLRNEVARLTAALTEARVRSTFSTAFVDVDKEELARVTALLVDQKKVNEALQKQIAAMGERGARDNTIESLRNELASAEDQLTVMTNAHSKAKEALKSEYEKIAKDRDAELEDVLSSNNERHAAEIAKMRAEQTQAVANLLSAHDLDRQHMEATYQADMIALDESRAEIRRLKESLQDKP